MKGSETERPFESRPRPPPVGPGRSPYDERLDALLRAATRLISQQGYERASMRRIAREAGVSLAGLYHYVDGKQKILFLIQFRTFSALLAGLRERLHGVRRPVEQLRVLVRNHVMHFAADLPALRVCSHELDSLDGPAWREVKRVRQEYYREAHAIIERLIATEAPNGHLDPHVATMSLFGTLNWLYRWYDPATGRSAASVAQQIAGQFLDGVRDGGRTTPASHEAAHTMETPTC